MNKVNWKYGFIALAFFGILGIILPYYGLRLLDEIVPEYMLKFPALDSFFSDVFVITEIMAFELLLLNGIILTIVATLYYLVEKGTLARVIMGALFLGTLAYLFWVGSSLYSLFLPQVGFGQIEIGISPIAVKADMTLIYSLALVCQLFFLTSAFLEYLSYKLEE